MTNTLLVHKSFGHSFLLSAGEMARASKATVYVFRSPQDERTPYRLSASAESLQTAKDEGWSPVAIVGVDGSVFAVGD